MTTTIDSLQQQVAAQEKRITTLETSLADTQQQNSLLRAAIAHFETRIATLEQTKASPVTTPRTKRNSLNGSDSRPSTASASPAGSRSASNKGKPPRPTTADVKKVDKPAIPTGKEVKTGDGKPDTKSSIPSATKPKSITDRLSTGNTEHKAASHSANAEMYNVGKHNIYVERPAKYKSMTPSDAPPRQHLELEYAYGYNGGYRGNLAYTNENKLVYTLAGTGIVSDLKTQEQHFFLEHNEDIVSMAIHPNRHIVATGQRDPKGKGTPYICIWDTTTRQQLNRFIHHERGVIALAFSTDGSKLISVGDDDSHSGAIWAWEEKPKPVAEGKQHEPLVSFIVAKDEVFGARAVTMDGDDKSTFSWVTYGLKHLKVWHAKKAGDKWEVTSRIPMTLEITKVVQKAYHGITPVHGTGFVAGTHDGHIYVFDGAGKLVSFHKINEQPVSALTIDDKGRLMIATYAGQVHIFESHQGIKDKDKDLNIVPIYPNAQARAMDYHAPTNTLLIGTKSGEIIQTSLEWKQSKTVMKGHTDELWGLAIHPTTTHMAVGAQDKILRIWDYSTHQYLIQIGLGHAIRYASYNHDGTMLAVGHKNGFITVIDTSDIRAGMEYHDGLVFFQKKIHKEQVDAIAFSPNGQLLVAGSWDQTISVHEIRSAKGDTRATPRPMSASKKGKVEAKDKEKEDKSKWILTLTKMMKGHTASISHLMISTDSKWAASNSRDYEILYWDLERGVRTNALDPETKWAEWTNILGWPLQGIWANAGDGTDVNSVSISGTDDTPDSERVICIGDDQGHATLYAYPALHKKPQHKEVQGHSAHVTQVRFTRDSQHLISLGGGDLGVFQWKVTK